MIHVNFSEQYEFRNDDELTKILNGQFDQKQKSIQFLREPQVVVQRLTNAKIQYYMQK